MRINNTVIPTNPGLLAAPAQTKSNNPLAAGTLSLNNPQNANFSANQSGISGLRPSLNPSLGSLGTTPVTSHTITTNSDGTMTQKVTHAATPITGDTQTPSGATVNATSGGLITAPTSQTPSLSGSVEALQNFQTPASTQANQQAQTAFNQTQAIQNELEQSRQNEARSLADIGEQPIPLGDITGRQQVAANLYQQQQNALASRAQAESNLYAPALSAATTGQGQQESALATAGGLATPSNQFITVPFNQQLVGSDGQPIGGASGNGALQSAVVNAINLIKSGSGYSNAVQAANLSQFGPQGTTALLNALGPNFNVNMSDADAADVALNINTTGTAATSAANTAYNTAVQKVAANTATYSALSGVSSNLNDTLANWGNTGLLTNYNQAINTIGGLTSNPDYKKFVTALGNAQAAYQAALGSSGVTPTKADQDAVAALSPNSTATAINAALNQLSADAHALLIVPAYQQQDAYAKLLGIK